jgi:SAM-dependent methyltransferase
MGPVDAVDERALAYACAPVLDVGCGPGRHTAELAARGVITMGIDVTAPALVHARARGASVLERCVFDPLPGTGRWASALLLDGNIAIGGDAVRLLNRLRVLLRRGGVIVAEFNAEADDAAARGRDAVDARLLCDAGPGPWFAWRPVPARDARRLAAAARLGLDVEWVADGRAFAVFRRP